MDQYFVVSKYPFEKIALDLIGIRQDGVSILVAIDYFSKYMNAAVIKTKYAKTIDDILNKWCNEG